MIIPEGWVLVPIIPTKEMLQHGVKENRESHIDIGETDEDAICFAYQAMLAVAPKVPS